MRPILFGSMALVLVAAACASPADNFQPDTIVGFEKAALDRWGKGDPDGYFEIMAPDVSYFDPMTDLRIDGKADLEKLIAPFRGKISIERAELINPVVQRQGDLAVLTFNLISHGGQFDGGPKRDVRWNCTEVYRLIDGAWKIVHTHWSYTKPEVAQAGP
jgi:ketosteroid isomerase-like protein